ncbi:MAG: DUF3794 domain-containing protein [Clostridia bacterium]|nr:DUF3794 domain-containing protein [Clostridia bacterium]
MKKKVLQVPVIIGKGSGQFFVEKDVMISPPSPPIFKIEEIDKKVIVTDFSVIPGKVIFNAYIWKNVIYKTVEDVCDGIVNGPIFHSTFKIPFGGFVEIHPIGCECIRESDIAELLEAFVEGEKDFLHCETCVKGEKVFTHLLEKDVVKIVFKVVRIEHVEVCCDEEEEEKDRCEEKHEKKEEKHEKKCEYEEKKEKKEEKCEDKRYDCRGDYYANCRGERFYHLKG